MIDLDEYIKRFIDEAKKAYGKRLMYVGLQGSRLRGEATEDSDIDIMVVIDELTVNDMNLYREILDSVGNRDKSCGFLCGRDELSRWTSLEAYQLLETTKDLYNSLFELLPKFDRQDEILYVKTSLGNIYHELCHRYVHSDREKNVMKFRATCKYFFFLIQNLHYLETGDFIKTKRELIEAVGEEDQKILKMAKLPDDFDFDKEFKTAFEWCQKAFARIDSV